MAYRERHRTVGEAQHPEPPIESETVGAERTEPVTEEQTRNERERRRKNTAKSDEQTNANTVPRPARIAFVDQLRKQHPEGAAGYRLVLPARSPADTPKIVPVPDSQGGIRYWRLEAFEIPDDIRLQEGLSYRVLWVDAAGQPLAPTTPYVPRLYFFLGPPDSEQDERNAAYEAILRDVHDPALRQSLEADVARSRLALQREREREAIRKQQTEQEERLYRIHTQQIEDDRRRRREDRTEQERQHDREKAERERQQAEQNAKNEREMWTAFKVMGGIAAAVAIGWGPFSRFLDSLQKQPDAGQALGPLLEKVETLLSAQKSIAPQTPNEPHRDDKTGQQKARSTATAATAAANVPSADAKPASVPTIPPVPPSQPADTARAATEAQHTPQAETAAAVPVPVASSSPNQSSSETGPIEELLSDSQLQTVLGIVLDPERMAQVAYENDCAKARMLGSPLPPASTLDLSPTELKEIREVFSSEILCSALLSLYQRFQAASTGGGEAMFALPAPFPSLQPHDRDNIHRAVATPAQRDYFLFQNQRREARLSGLPMPPPRATQVPDKEQKAIRRLFRDERVMRYLCTSGALSS